MSIKGKHRERAEDAQCRGGQACTDIGRDRGETLARRHISRIKTTTETNTRCAKEQTSLQPYLHENVSKLNVTRATPYHQNPLYKILTWRFLQVLPTSFVRTQNTRATSDCCAAICFQGLHGARALAHFTLAVKRKQTHLGTLASFDSVEPYAY